MNTFLRKLVTFLVVLVAMFIPIFIFAREFGAVELMIWLVLLIVAEWYAMRRTSV